MTLVQGGEILVSSWFLISNVVYMYHIKAGPSLDYRRIWILGGISKISADVLYDEGGVSNLLLRSQELTTNDKEYASDLQRLWWECLMIYLITIHYHFLPVTCQTTIHHQYMIILGKVCSMEITHETWTGRNIPNVWMCWSQRGEDSWDLSGVWWLWACHVID